MSASVRISAKDARDLAQLCVEYGGQGMAGIQARLRAALSKTKRLSVKRLPSVKAKKTKKQTKKEETMLLRQVLFERARGHCELCGDEGGEMHHALSRRVPQDISNVLFCCRACHRDITNNRPSAVDVLQAQAGKFGELGHFRTVQALLSRRDFVLARSARRELSRKAVHG